MNTKSLSAPLPPPARTRAAIASIAAAVVCAVPAPGIAGDAPGTDGARWPARKANDWYAKTAWPVGANFVPSTAVNQLEMWQAETFDPETINRELGYAAGIGMNTMRVFLHDIPWRTDADGFFKRIDRYLEIADRHGIRTMFVVFDGVWNPDPKPGPQPDPKPGVHNSGWVQSPGRAILDDPKRQDELKPYVQALLGRYKNDRRVLVWDLFNEPDNSNDASYGKTGSNSELPPDQKAARAKELLLKTFAWARETNPSQPLTCGVWRGDYFGNPDALNRICLGKSDIISFHTYSGPKQTRQVSAGLIKLARPVFCTEYMARGANSTFQGILPIFKKSKIAAYNWGLVKGRSQTIYPWGSWRKPYNKEPKPWFHDIFRKDGTPYDKAETEFIRKLRCDVSYPGGK